MYRIEQYLKSEKEAYDRSVSEHKSIINRLHFLAPWLELNKKYNLGGFMKWSLRCDRYGLFFSFAWNDEIPDQDRFINPDHLFYEINNALPKPYYLREITTGYVAEPKEQEDRNVERIFATALFLHGEAGASEPMIEAINYFCDGCLRMREAQKGEKK
jgi:hypothetical protein